jgi:uncharacterized protein
MNLPFYKQIAQELSLPEPNVVSTMKLLDEGNTIPFIARYRKEVTGSLDEVQVRQIQERALYLKEMEDRKKTILESIRSQGKLTEALEKTIQECQIKATLEDLYLPFKPKRRTKAMIAREKGYEPLALTILKQPLTGDPLQEAASFENPQEALEGAGHIIAEIISEMADIRSLIREIFQNEGLVCSKVRDEFKDKETKFKQYYDFKELIRTIPSHRFLAIRRGEQELVLSVDLWIEEEPVIEKIKTKVGLNPKSPFAKHLGEAIHDSYKRLLAPSLESDVRIDLKLGSDKEAVNVFAQNLGNLLLSSPMGGKKVVGIDPGLRTGCKCAAVCETGKFLDTTTFFLLSEIGKAKREFLQFIKKHKPVAIAIGNGTASRETETFVKEVLKEEEITTIIVVQVSESGASVYSASDIAREEFPELDLTVRGAISIARRLQDPLAELVKVEPKSLGVGQYQHDVYQPLLESKLNEVVESCVNKVGVDLNTASASLLSYVAGIGPSLSKKIIKHREEKGPFRTRKQLTEVSGLGPKAFEQSAGFLRINDGENPLDSSAVHPERYPIIEKMAETLKVSLKELIGQPALIDKIDLKSYRSQTLGEETLQDIIGELKKPGRDPRKSFEMPKFLDGICKLEDLKQGMCIEGIVTNVTAFGAFVDIGVHQDGLVHISELSNTFVKDPHEVVKTGDRLKVTVLEVDCKLKRISLSAKQGATGVAKAKPTSQMNEKINNEKFNNNPFAKLFG